MARASFNTLPMELIYYILDDLDLQTILFSFRNVCKRFYACVHEYNRYKLDFSSVSKTDFHRICHIIRPQNVMSLTLSDGDMTPGQTRLFVSLFHVDQFIHLHSLTLIQIDKSELNILVELINFNSLKSLLINLRKNILESKNVSMIPLLSSMVPSSLQKLDLSIWNYEISNIVWPEQNALQHLTIGHHITVQQVCTILGHLSNLRTLVLRNSVVNDTDKTIDLFNKVEKNTNLTSLIFIDSCLQMNELEVLLFLTPSLVHLELRGTVHSSDGILDGSRWQKLIQNKLLLLEKFEFFFRAKVNSNQNFSDIASWIIPFRSTFWLKQKSWFVTCNYVIRTAIIRLYTMPICDPCITYESDFNKTTFTNCTTIDNEMISMNNVNELFLDLTEMMATVKAHKIRSRTEHLFRKLTDLTLTISEEWPSNSIEYLSTLINLPHITTLGLRADFDQYTMFDTINNIGYLLKQAYNVRSLTFSNSYYFTNVNGIVEHFCSIIPHHVKHLDMNDMGLEDIKMLLERLNHLSSVTFVFQSHMPFELTEVVDWLSGRITFTYLADNYSLSIWLGDSVNVPSKVVQSVTL